MEHLSSPGEGQRPHADGPHEAGCWPCRRAHATRLCLRSSAAPFRSDRTIA